MYWHPVFYCTLFYFLVGAVSITFINKKRQSGNQERWLKYGVYFLLVHAIIGSILYAPTVFTALAIALVLIGVFELIFAWRKSGKASLLLVISLLVYLFFTIGFLSFAFEIQGETQVWIYLLVVTFDGFSQIIGQAFGRTPLVPKISPGKTVAGFIGGFITTIFTGYIITVSGWFNVSFPEATIFVVLISLFAFSGDLLASFYKRKVGIKDYSRIIPGHGGVLDRFDSFITVGAIAGFAVLLAQNYK
jgi:phosphatidate cytidylyltransferase